MPATATSRPVVIPVGPGIALDADLGMPERPLGVVAFAHGSASSRPWAAALVAAARLEPVVKAVVSRGGRPDLAMAHLTRSRARRC